MQAKIGQLEAFLATVAHSYILEPTRPARQFYCSCQMFPLHLPEPYMSLPLSKVIIIWYK